VSLALDPAPAPEAGQSAARRDTTLVGLLGVELLLLAFFIMLTGVGHFEKDKVKAVLGSVQSTFADGVGLDGGSGLVGAADGSLDGLRGELGGLVATMVPLGHVRNASPSREVRAEFPADSLFRAGENQLGPVPQAFLARLAAVLRNDPPGYGYDIAVLGVGPAGDMGGAARSAAIVRALVAAGVAADRLCAGVVPGADRLIRIDIRLVDANAAEPSVARP